MPLRRLFAWIASDWSVAGVAALEVRIMPAPIGYSPAQIERAYGYDQVSFDVGGVKVPGDGRGITVALFEVGATPALCARSGDF